MIHDLLSQALEYLVCYDQLDGSNLACAEVIARTYQLVEETHGSMKIEGVEHYIGKPTSMGTRRGVALAPVLSRHATSKLARETDILKQRRKAREEAIASKSNKK